MRDKFSVLTNRPLKAGTSFSRPTQVLPQNVTLNDPAISVMTDLRSVSVVNVRAKTSLDKANAKMIRYGVRTLLVLDDADKVVGFLTATDVMGEKPVRFLQQVGGTHADIMVSDVMTVQSELEALSLEDVLKAKVGNILGTLKAAGRQHAMVVEENADGSQTVRGLFSATQIARQLGLQIKTAEVAKIFSEIEAAVGSH
ncbi:CBS domain protein [mine drainage metagenome]|uniref:CBS domain protein n=1 Tax=mine drainage metagenome TaxID=410659 RepID=A0A1J5THF9_9ZZZZ